VSSSDRAAFALTTPRCRLCPLDAADDAALHALFTSPGIRRYLWDDEVIPLAQTRDVIERSRRMFAADRFGLWGVRATGVAGLAGFAGLWPFRDPPEIELLYGIAEPAWGQGYAAEAAAAVLAYSFDALGADSVRASTGVANRASMRVLDKLGFAFVDRRVAGGLDTMFYELRRLERR
jgi:ribosomal-protein-alanine N-acetyltransferase